MDRQRVPQDVLDAFPVIWSYDQVGPNQVALTQARYTGFTHDGRTGNYFAHVLVFDPVELKEIGDNPLALSRSGIFRMERVDNGTTLPTVASLAPSSLPSADLSVLAADPYREHLAAMISALCSARLARQPVLICLAAWQSATPLAEALLDLVPPAERRMTTFSTYESDRTWTPASKTGRRTGAEPAHQVIILCGQGDRMWNLRSDEYQSVYAVFNFVEGRVSELGSPRPYAAFAAEHVLAGDGDTLRAYYQLLDQLGAGADPDAWDRLTPAASLSQGSVASDALAQAAQALAGIAERPQAARTALSLLLPHVNSLAQTDNSDAIISLAPSLATLLSRLRTPELTAAAAASPAAGDPASVLQSLADEALAVGRARTAAALLKACGPARELRAASVARSACFPTGLPFAGAVVAERCA